MEVDDGLRHGSNPRTTLWTGLNVSSRNMVDNASSAAKR